MKIGVSFPYHLIGSEPDFYRRYAEIGRGAGICPHDVR